MIDVAVFTNPESAKILLVITLAVSSILILIVGYLLSRRDSAISSATENLTVIVGQLKELVSGLTMQYSIRQPIIDELLKDHARQLSEHNNSITKLQTEHNMFHCGYSPKPRSRKSKLPDENNIN